jgi:hypothetical protein
MTGAVQSHIGLEDVWRARVEQARRNYETAKSECQNARRTIKNGAKFQPDTDFAVRIALYRETMALHEYARSIRIFKDIVIKGTSPDGSV